MFNYNDDYMPKSEDTLGDGSVLYLVESSGTVLRNRRKQLNMTQQEVANAADIQLRQYQRLENNERSMTGASMRIGLAICAVLKLDPYRFSCVSQKEG